MARCHLPSVVQLYPWRVQPAWCTSTALLLLDRHDAGRGSSGPAGPAGPVGPGPVLVLVSGLSGSTGVCMAIGVPGRRVRDARTVAVF